jgi:hypothetical protein
MGFPLPLVGLFHRKDTSMKLADSPLPRRPSVRTRRRLTAISIFSGILVSAAALALAGCSSAGSAADGLALAGNTGNSGPTQISSDLAGGYQIVTLNNRRDLTFNQLLGINNEGAIAGYFGSGAAGHPNQGYVLLPPFAQRDFGNENFPRSVQTQVTGLNDDGISVGFWSNQDTASMANDNFAFYSVDGRFHNLNFPTRDNASPSVNQLLGVNDHGLAVGFYTESGGTNVGYEYNIQRHRFTLVQVPGTPRGASGPSLTAAGINNGGDIAGFFNKTATKVDAFLFLRSGKFITLAYPGATMTQAFGVNDSGEVVGSYTVGSGNSAVTHGFVWLNGKFASVDVKGASSTAINGINDEGDLVGFYTDAKGNTDGFVALP